MQFDRKIEISCEISFKYLELTGNFSLIKPGIFGSSSAGPFSIKIYDLEIFGLVELGADKSGKFRAKEIKANADVKKMETEFKNLGGLAGFFTGFIKGEKTVSKFSLNSQEKINIFFQFFNLVKPDLIKEGQKIIKAKIDENIDENLDENFKIPNSVNTIDFAISEARKFVKKW